MAKRASRSRKQTKPKQLSRYEHSDATDPRTPETGHTSDIREEETVELPMDTWTKGLEFDVGAPKNHPNRMIVGLDPAVDPILLWSGKRSHSDVPLLPLQRNEVVAESRIARIVSRARDRVESGPTEQLTFSELEKTLREADRDRPIEFYLHAEQWRNKLICGDSLHCMESLLKYEGLTQGVQMIFVDPPYGIDYDSNFQQRVDSAGNEDEDVLEDVLTIKAFRDTWSLGIHSYLEHLRERLYLCRELLTDSGSLFFQIGTKNVHLIRVLMDEVFGRDNFVSQITFRKKLMPLGSKTLESMADFLIWYAKDKQKLKYRQLYKKVNPDPKSRWTGVEEADGTRRKLRSEEAKNLALLPPGSRVYRTVSQLAPSFSAANVYEFEFEGAVYSPPSGQCWVTSREKMEQLARGGRLEVEESIPYYVLYHEDFPYQKLTNPWNDTSPAQNKQYAVQTSELVLERCIAMTTDPGELVFDPTAGSGTTAVVAERLGRRWVTCDVSRVSTNIVRQRLLRSLFPSYKLKGRSPSAGFELRSADRTSLKSIANELEPERIEFVDRPIVDNSSVRVCGPFEVMSLGRYSVEDWKGYFVRGEQEGLENYISAICRLYRKDVGLPDLGGLVHGLVEAEGLGLSVGPIAGRVTAKQLYDAATDGVKLGLKSMHVLGWAFETNVGEVKKTIEAEDEIALELIMIRPDTLIEGLKVTQPEMLFSPLAQPDVDIASVDGKLVAALNGVAVFDRKRRTTDYMKAGGGYVAAWYLDEDYDGDCFIDSQMFFPFKKKPPIEKALKIDVDEIEWSLRLTSDPFEPGNYRHCAVKVVDIYGNESTIVRELAQS